MKRRFTSDEGNLIVEFAIIVPVILLIAFGALDISRAMRVKQIAQTLSRESASLAYRDCSVQPGTTTTDCLDLVQQRMNTRSGMVLPGSQIVLTLYSYDPVAGNITQYGPSGGTSKYSLSRLNTIGDNVGNMVRAQREVVIAEINAPYSSLLAPSTRLFQLGERTFYDVSIL